jgi:hypothetical protein
VVRDLMTEMAKQGAIGLAHLVAAPLALGVVGLGEIDGDQAVFVPGQHRRRAIGEKIEGHAFRVFGAGGEGQSQLQERVEQPVLGGLHHAPMGEIVRLRQVGDHAVVPARSAELFGALGRD